MGELPTHREPSQTTIRGAPLLRGGGAVLLVATPLAALWFLYAESQTEAGIGADFVLRLIVVSFACALAGGLLLAVASLLEQVRSLRRAVERMGEAGGDDQDGCGPDDDRAWSDLLDLPQESDDDGSTDRALRDIQAALQELRDLTLLPEERRLEVRRRLVSVQGDRLGQSVTQAIEEGRFRAAREQLADAVARFGPSRALDELRDRIDAGAKAAEPLAYARAVRQIEEALARQDWDRGEQVARMLVAQHGSPRCRRVLDDTRRSRLYALIQAHTTRRHWDEAVAAAEQFLDTYPNCPESETLLEEIATLRDNAEIQRRKRLELQFRDLTSQCRLAEALRLARHVIDTYPGSPQATALHAQVPDLERQLAEQ